MGDVEDDDAGARGRVVAVDVAEDHRLAADVALKARILPCEGDCDCSGKVVLARYVPVPTSASPQAASASSLEARSIWPLRQVGRPRVSRWPSRLRPIVISRSEGGVSPERVLTRPAIQTRDRGAVVAGQGLRFDAAVEGDEEVAAGGQLGVDDRGGGRRANRSLTASSAIAFALPFHFQPNSPSPRCGPERG